MIPESDVNNGTLLLKIISDQATFADGNENYVMYLNREPTQQICVVY